MRGIGRTNRQGNNNLATSEEPQNEESRQRLSTVLTFVPCGPVCV